MASSLKTAIKIGIISIGIILISYISIIKISIISSFQDVLANKLGGDFIKIYNESILKKNANLIDVINNTDPNRLIDNHDFVSFAQDNLSYFKELSIVKFNIYNKSGSKIFTNNQSKVIDLKNYTDKLSIIDSIIVRFNNIFYDDKIYDTINPKELNHIYSNFIANSAYKYNDKQLLAPIIRILIPVGVKTLPVPVIDLYIEIYVDVSDFISNINNQYYILFGIFVIFMILLYTSLYIIWNSGDKLVERLHEQNTELKEAKSKAEKESIEKSQFLANVSHELRTPLNAIIGFSEIIKTEAMGPIGNPQYKDYINDINNSGTHLLSLINDILDYSKAEAEKLEVDSIEVDLTKTMVTSMRFVQPRADAAKIQLVSDFPKEHIVMIADPKRLKQVLLNMLSNSVKFTPEGGSVTLSASKDDEKGEVIIQVKDTGIGIAERDIPKAMSTFGQVDSKLSRKYEGTGLGLPLTKKLVELMNGSFSLQSQLGFGTIITMRFPSKRPI